MINWSQYQHDIFEFTEIDSRNLIVQALAGSAKSTTLTQCLKFINPKSKNLLCAFNKKIAEELKSKAPGYVSVYTLHALGLKSLSKVITNFTVDSNKSYVLLEKIIKKVDEKNKDEVKQRKELIYLVAKAISMAKNCLLSTDVEIDIMMDDYDIVPPLEYPREDFINNVLFGLESSKYNTTLIDFDDMIYLPNVLDLKMESFDNIFVDEAQDLNPAQIELIFRLSNQNKKKKSRYFIFLDENQAIYRFRGADANVLKTFQEKLDAHTLPLPITYRCPKAVVKEAQRYTPHMEPAPNAKEGKVSYLTYKEFYKNPQKGSFVLSRANAPLVKTALTLLSNKVPCQILGRDISEGLINLIKNSRTKTIESFQEYLNKWYVKEVARLTKRNMSVSNVSDKKECLEALMAKALTINDLKSTIESLFKDVDNTSIITLGTVHATKGLERDVVYLITNTFNESNQEEKNICYVAKTRSKSELYYLIKEKDSKKQKSAQIDE